VCASSQLHIRAPVMALLVYGPDHAVAISTDGCVQVFVAHSVLLSDSIKLCLSSGAAPLSQLVLIISVHFAL
jgi:hypothetical protein